MTGTSDIFRVFAVFACLTLAACPGDASKEELRVTVRELADRVGALESKVFALQEAAGSAGSRRDDESDFEEKVITPARFHVSPSFLDDPFVGSKRAPVLVMVFSNFQCKPCRLFHKTSFQELRERYVTRDDVQLVFRDFPLENNEWSAAAGALAHCAGEGGGYWKMFDLLVANEPLVDTGNLLGIAQRYDKPLADKLLQCAQSKRYEDEVDADRKDGVALGAKGAPGTFVGRLQESGEYSGVFIRGAQPAALIDREVRRASAEAPSPAATPAPGSQKPAR